MIDVSRVHNVPFKGGVASIPVEPTAEMLELESQADGHRLQATRLHNQSYEIGQEIAEGIFRQKHPNY